MVAAVAAAAVVVVPRGKMNVVGKDEDSCGS